MYTHSLEDGNYSPGETLVGAVSREKRFINQKRKTKNQNDECLFKNARSAYLQN